MGKKNVSDIGAGQMAALIVDSATPPAPEPSISEPYTIVLDSTLTIAEMVAAGHYDGYVSPDITAEHFPVVEGETKVEAVLVCFARYIESKEAIAMMYPLGYLPAIMPEGLAFGAQHPGLQRQHPGLQRQNPIVFLGSVWTSPSGYRFVGCLYDHSDLRDLGLDEFDRRWSPDFRFLFVRKPACR